MRQHPYLRAYMAGIAVPTPFLLVVMAAFVVGRLIYQVPIPIERVIVFPMAVIPNLWGLWNMLYVRLRVRWHIPIGIYGAALVLLIAPLGFAVAALLGFQVPHRALAPFGLPVGLVVYYLVWKYVVGFLNAVQGVC